MDQLNPNFFKIIDDIAYKINNYVENKKSVCLVSSLNPDGLASSILLLKYFYDNDIETHLTYVYFYNKEIGKELLVDQDKRVEEDVVILLDFGSYYANEIREITRNLNKEVIIIDNHQSNSKDINLDRVYLLNPNIFNIDGLKMANTSSITHLLLESLNGKIEEYPLFLSLLGSVYEFPDQREFYGINKIVLEKLLEKNIVSIKKGLLLTGLYSRPLFKAISSSFEIYIPRVTGSDTRALEFLKKIFDRKEIESLYYKDLNSEEEKKLISEIISLRLKNNLIYNENVVGDVVLLENKEYIFGDLRELNSFFISSIFLNEINLLIRYILSKDKNLGSNLLELLNNYRMKISNNLSEYIDKKIKMIEKGNILVLEINKNTKYSIGGYFLDILILNNLVSNKLVIALQKIDEENYIGNIRIAGRGIILRKETNDLLRNIVDKLDLKYFTGDPIGGFLINSNKINNLIELIEKSFK